MVSPFFKPKFNKISQKFKKLWSVGQNDAKKKVLAQGRKNPKCLALDQVVINE